MLTLFGTATGCIGMSVDDFCRCTPREFQAVYEAWAEDEKRRERAAWERTRMQCTIMLQPYSKKALNPKDVFHFDWDASTDSATDESEQLTAKEIRERFEKVKREQGLE